MHNQVFKVKTTRLFKPIFDDVRKGTNQCPKHHPLQEHTSGAVDVHDCDECKSLICPGMAFTRRGRCEFDICDKCERVCDDVDVRGYPARGKAVERGQGTQGAADGQTARPRHDSGRLWIWIPMCKTARGTPPEVGGNR